MEKTQAANWCTHYISIVTIQIEGEITELMVRVHATNTNALQQMHGKKCSVMTSHGLCQMTIEKTRYQIISLFWNVLYAAGKIPIPLASEHSILFLCFDSTEYAQLCSVQVQYATSAQQNVCLS